MHDDCQGRKNRLVWPLKTFFVPIRLEEILEIVRLGFLMFLSRYGQKIGKKKHSLRELFLFTQPPG